MGEKGMRKGGEETALVKQLLDYLAYKKIWRYRVNSGALLNPAGRLVRFGKEGHPDIVARLRPVHPDQGSGRVIWIECKSKAGKLSPAQKEWQVMSEEHGDVFILARSLSDVSCLFDKPVGEVLGKDARNCAEDAPGSTIRRKVRTRV